MFTEEEFKHWFIPRPGIVDTYIVEGKNNEITGIPIFVLNSVLEVDNSV